ncbi:MAG: hypothetical protein ACI88A_003195 [Paraglaciecola sp.]|jgi:hypothetical protein
MIFWKVTFWLTASLLILPFPFKLAGYISGKDTSPLRVKIEEMANALFLAIGLIAFWAYAYTKPIAIPPVFWYIWLTVSVVWSCLGVFKSSKLTYAKSQIGGKATVLFALGSTLFFLPMLVAVFNYASKT